MSRTDILQPGDVLWTPSPDRIERARITRFRGWLSQELGLEFKDYEALWRWSVTDVDGFWRALWGYFQIDADGSIEQVVSGEQAFKARWFKGVRTNYAEHLLRYEAKAAIGETVFCHLSETRPLATMSWQDLGGQVRVLATKLREMGIQPGDRIVSYMPNVPETAVAMIASVAIGAIWSSAAPEFGAKMVIERFSQIAPKLAFFADGYSFNGRIFDRRDEIKEIAASLPSLQAIVWLPYVGVGDVTTDVEILSFSQMLSGPPVNREAFRYERVPSDHPLWVLFSSGTTGLPKAIVHGHAGMIVEHLKGTSFHYDFGPGKRSFISTTTGWMMWNALIASLITGASAVLYDGSPMHGGVDALWRIADTTKATFLGASPALVRAMQNAQIRPCDTYGLEALDTIVCAGSPATPETFSWFYRNVSPDLWVSSQSGGTEICGGLLAGVPILPSRAGEIQVRALGIAVAVWDDQGREVVDEIGELVVTKSFPSAPLFFWGDEGDARYRESYFSTFPDVWRHGDRAKINSRGGGFIYGRSDATLNRFGVRIGSAEIYRVLEQAPGVVDSLVVCCETPDGGFYMPLFVSLEPGQMLSDGLKKAITSKLASEASPRHVPDEIYQAPGIPYTLTGKKMEVPIRKLLMGAAPDQAISRDAMADPVLLDWYVAFANRPDVRVRRHVAS